MLKSTHEELNPKQRSAITHTGGPLLVLAGAGSGKTRVITHRFAHISKKSPHNSILAVTFTNKAAEELKERISCLTGTETGSDWIGTFHSQCNRLLRKEIRALGYGCDYTIYDDDDQSGLIRHILKEFKIYEALYKGIQTRISSLKSSCITPDEFLSKGQGFGFEEKLTRVYVRYQDELKRCNALDYDDLIMFCIRLFEEHPEILNKYRRQFKHILIDEFQDTNAAQYKLIRLLSAENTCAVGDDDQSIYGFRGANVNNILNFEKDFPGTTVIKLEQNYRSSRNILNVSGCIIKNNNVRTHKKLWSDRNEGESVCQCWFGTEDEEAKFISKLMKELYLKGKYDFKDFAVLYRINLQSRALEDALRHEKLPYRVLGGISFYQRKEIKDVAAYMKLALNHDDNVSLRRIINTPPRGIGASTLSRLEQDAKNKSISLYGSIKNVIKSGGLSSSIREKLEGFQTFIEGLSAGKFRSASEILSAIYKKSGYADFIEEDRAENIKEFIRSGEGVDMEDFLVRLSLYTHLDDRNTGNAVSLLTLHSAKGLEFPAVFITGVEEGVLPYFKAKSPSEIEEERRLLYVGMTRAKDKLWLTGAKKRRLYSKVQEQEASRFIKELPEGTCEKMEMYTKPVTPPSESRWKVPAASAAKAFFSYAVGSRVKHQKWGIGVVRDCYGEGNDQKITVNFPRIGVKRLSLKFANLERIR